jgi:outer membrane protein OmpA-like peptidoglycan-associated protein
MRSNFLLFLIIICCSCNAIIEKKKDRLTKSEFDSVNISLTTQELVFDSIQGIYIERTTTKYVKQDNTSIKEIGKNEADEQEKLTAVKTGEVDWQRTPIRLGHSINTNVSEYYPCPLSDGKILFTGMDRTGHFDYKLDFTKTQNAGGEDAFIAENNLGFPEDARPIPNSFNTNAHESVTQVLASGDYLMTANYQENLNNAASDQGLATPDLFIGKINSSRVVHLPEPVNSIFGEFDGFMFNGNKAILFVSDRPEGTGEYKKKGWLWNDNLWGNTDIYVSFNEEGTWTQPINLGTNVNTPFAERTPWLSPDGKTLYISTNAYSEGRNDLDIYMLTRNDTKVWDQWTKPVKLLDVCSDGDDWCYKIDNNTGNVFFSRSLKLNYKTSLPAREGDAYVRETGWRPGYTVFGAQSAALRRDYQMDIFMITPPEKPTIVLPDIVFSINSAKIKNDILAKLELLVDFSDLNSKRKIKIIGYTDNTGSKSINDKLSLERADAVKKILTNNGIDESKISVVGMGSSNPIAPNNNPSNRQKNRRVEIYFY